MVSQFTLAADTRKAAVPAFHRPQHQSRRKLYLRLRRYEKLGLPVETGQFAADMQVELVNDGPVTLN